jgi:carbonic anhydrase
VLEAGMALALSIRLHSPSGPDTLCRCLTMGPAQAAMTHRSLGLINKWLRNIKDVYRIHKAEVDAQPTEQARLDRLVELNVQEQVFALMKTSIIQQAWKERGGPHLHGWVYRLNDGLVHTVCEVPPGAPIDPIYWFDNLV